MDVRHGNRDRESANGRVSSTQRFARADRYVRGRAAHVQGHDPIESRRGGHGARADHSSGRTAQHRLDRCRRGLGRSQDSATGLDDPQLPGGRAFQPTDVPAHHGRHVRINHGCTRALVLTMFGQHFRRNGDPAHAGSAQGGTHRALVRRPQEAEEQTYRGGFRLELTHFFGKALKRFAAQWSANGAVRAHAFIDLESKLSLNQRRRPARLNVVERGTILAGDLQHIAEPGRCDQCRTRALALEHRVCRHGRAVHHGPISPDSGTPQALQHSLSRVVRRAGDLKDVQSIVRSDGEVSERAADIHTNADSVHWRPLALFRSGTGFVVSWE